MKTEPSPIRRLNPVLGLALAFAGAVSLTAAGPALASEMRIVIQDQSVARMVSSSVMRVSSV